MAEVKIDLNFDKNLDGILVMTCPHCATKNETAFKDIKPGTSLTCNCGFEVSFSGYDLKRTQCSLDDLKCAYNSLMA